jgi:hypothetical protein|tara:strand:+ start:636 stop:860 length:225 start_codon:yes stop_codon:yes gene_type:complete
MEMLDAPYWAPVDPVLVLMVFLSVIWPGLGFQGEKPEALRFGLSSPHTSARISSKRYIGRTLLIRSRAAELDHL